MEQKREMYLMLLKSYLSEVRARYGISKINKNIIYIQKFTSLLRDKVKNKVKTRQVNFTNLLVEIMPENTTTTAHDMVMKYFSS